MARGRSEKMMTWIFDGALRREPDDLIVEEPMSIQLDGTLVSTTMRTPGDDFDLAVGFCHAEGLLAGAPVTGIRYCFDGAATETDFNVVTVETGGMAPEPTPRLGSTSSSCGLCGAEAIAALIDRLRRLPDVKPIPLAVLAEVPEVVTDRQRLFASTGSVHAAAAFDRSGEPVLIREDIGRHNAVDKVVGRLLLEQRLPATDLGLFVSGRASFEMVQKAWAAGFSTVVAVSAPSALAVDTARAANVTLAGFARKGQMRVYAPAELRPTVSEESGADRRSR
ncbi:MAG: formate dehydrogenase accessory sulfurtransferase FdhD [Acidimicrobiales bacterium]